MFKVFIFYKRNINYFIIITLMIFVFIFISMIKPDADFTKTNTENIQTKKIKFNSCMKEAAIKYNSNSEKFFKEFSDCIKSVIAIDEKQMDIFVDERHNKKKVFLSMSDKYLKNECKWLTIGIGGSTAVEEAVKQKYTNCLIYGADPNNVGNFSKIGKLLLFQVGLEDSKIALSVNGNITFEKRIDPVMSFTRMLDEFVHSRLIHYLTMDIEGHEMAILSETIGFGKLSNENITFCQIDVELHNQTPELMTPKNTNLVQWVLEFLSESSPYLPVYTIPYNHGHKVTFVNIVNPECGKAFKIRSYFE